MSELRRFDPSAMKILVVGDHAFERRLVTDLLISLGVKSIFSADDGVAAFAQLMLKKPDMVIADAEMAPFSGYMLVREIRAAPIALKGVPIVLFTAETSSDFAEIVRAAGANEVLAKPVSVQALRKCLEDVTLRPRDFEKSAAYKGPERRRASMSGAPRRRANDPPPSKSKPVSIDRAVRAQILTGIDEARALIARWAQAGEPNLLDAAGSAIHRAAIAGGAAGADDALTQALNGALRLVDAARGGHADPRILEVSLSAARAVLSAPSARNAMRQALAEAVAEAAEIREQTAQ